MPDSSSYDTYLFDLDGTLIDSIELILSSYRHTAERHLGKVPPEEEWIAGIGTPLWVQFRRFTDDQAEIDAMVATYREHNLANHDQMVREYPGVRDAVFALEERGTRLGLVTSKKREGSLRGLASCGFDGLFGVLVTADDVERHKPDPEPVLQALRLLDADPDSTVFVGDSPHDMAAGRAAGVAIAAVTWGPFDREALAAHDPDHWVDDRAQLPGLSKTS